jgi:hypothetical protein
MYNTINCSLHHQLYNLLTRNNPGPKWLVFNLMHPSSGSATGSQQTSSEIIKPPGHYAV